MHRQCRQALRQWLLSDTSKNWNPSRRTFLHCHWHLPVQSLTLLFLFYSLFEISLATSNVERWIFLMLTIARNRSFTDVPSWFPLCINEQRPWSRLQGLRLWLAFEFGEKIDLSKTTMTAGVSHCGGLDAVDKWHQLRSKPARLRIACSFCQQNDFRLIREEECFQQIKFKMELLRYKARIQCTVITLIWGYRNSEQRRII